MEYKLIRSNRKTIGICVKNGEVIVRAPIRCDISKIDEAVRKHITWIEGKLAENKRRIELEPITSGEIQALAKKALLVIPRRVEYYSAIIGVSYGRITVRNQKTRWGSCSSKGDLNFNCLLMMAPPEVLDSVVVHELCHRKHMDHSKAFYAEVLKAFPEYRKWNGWLRENGGALIERMKKGMK